LVEKVSEVKGTPLGGEATKKKEKKTEKVSTFTKLTTTLGKKILGGRRRSN